MFSTRFKHNGGLIRKYFACISLLAFALAGFASASPAFAQDQPAAPQDNGQQKGTEAPPAAGGPTGDVGPYAVPKKKEEPPPPPPEKPKKIEGMPDYSIHVSVPLVEVPVLVTTKDGQFIPNLKQENFRVYEDGVQQNITNFGVSEAPITAVVLVEFASIYYGFTMEALQASYTFVSQLKKNDYIAVRLLRFEATYPGGFYAGQSGGLCGIGPIDHAHVCGDQPFRCSLRHAGQDRQH